MSTGKSTEATDITRVPVSPRISVYAVMPTDATGGWFNHITVCQECKACQPQSDWQSTLNWMKAHVCAWRIFPRE